MKFTKEELKNFLWDYNKFEYICEDICKELSRWDESFKFMDEFSIDDKSVKCEGDEYWSYGGHEHYIDYFDVELLTYSKDELKEYVDKKVAERDTELQKEKEEKEAYKKEQELKELERLKAKYEK